MQFGHLDHTSRYLITLEIHDVPMPGFKKIRTPSSDRYEIQNSTKNEINLKIYPPQMGVRRRHRSDSGTSGKLQYYFPIRVSHHSNALRLAQYNAKHVDIRKIRQPPTYTRLQRRHQDHPNPEVKIFHYVGFSYDRYFHPKYDTDAYASNSARGRRSRLLDHTHCALVQWISRRVCSLKKDSDLYQIW